MDTKLKPKRTVSFKTFLVPVPFPLVTTFETAGTYKKWLWPNSAHIMYTWHAPILWHTYLHTYIYIRTAPARICTPLIVSRPLHSLANTRIPITNLVANPETIFNMDETGMPLCPHPPKVVARKGQKKVRYQTSGQKSQVTILAQLVKSYPPFMIFAVKQISPLWTPDEVSGSRFAVSDSGWVDQELSTSG